MTHSPNMLKNKGAAWGKGLGRVRSSSSLGIFSKSPLGGATLTPSRFGRQDIHSVDVSPKNLGRSWGGLVAKQNPPPPSARLLAPSAVGS